MKIINASYEIVNKDKINGIEILKDIEAVGRTCYKSEANITDDSAKKFVAMLIDRGHEAMIEHNAISVRFICDRGVSHELVRHRLASFGQESTRYCNYSKNKFGNELTFIKPIFNKYNCDAGMYDTFEDTCRFIEKRYFEMLKHGATPQEARSILPNSLKTEIVMTMNLREWRHFFKLRCDKAAHPQTREIANMILKEFKEKIPVIFDDLYESFVGGINEKAE